MVHGKVARTLDRFTVVLNVGLSDGVTEGMEFVIYKEGPEVIDPDSGESLGAVELVKGQVSVTSVQDRLSIARAHTETVLVPNPDDVLAQLEEGLGLRMDTVSGPAFGFSKPKIPEAVTVISGGFRIEVEDEVTLEKVVRVGDLARSLLTD